MKLILAALALAALPTGPSQQEQCASFSLDVFKAGLVELEGSVIGGAGYPGAGSDAAIIYVVDGKVLMIGFLNGCHVRGPLLLDYVTDPAAPKLLKPKVGA